MITREMQSLTEFVPGFDMQKRWTLSEFLRAAITDLRWCMTSGDYLYSPGVWFVPRERTCSVCLAGAFLAQTCNLDPTKPLQPCWTLNYQYGFRALMYALNSFRTGDLLEGIRAFDSHETREFLTEATQKRLEELFTVDELPVDIDRDVTGGDIDLAPEEVNALEALYEDLEQCAQALEGLGL